MLKEFKTFAVRGNVLDLAIAVIIGAAFGSVVTSVVTDLMMPLLGQLYQADFRNLYVPLSDAVPRNVSLEEARAAGPVFAWGNFVTVFINFLILMIAIFMIVSGINRMKREEAADPSTPPAPSKQDVLLTEIRDELRRR